jgi:predicted ABC-class ATPase
MLEHLRSDAAKQAEVLRAACPRDILSDPVAQLDVSRSTAEAVLAAVNTVAPLVEEFYTTLSDEQKARLIAFGMRANDVNNDTRPVHRSARRLLRQGALEKSGLCQLWERAFRDLPKRGIGRELRLSDSQHSVLSVMTDSTNQAADELTKSCPADVLLTPVGRLRTLRKQLEAIGQAIETARPAIGHFYEIVNEGRWQ